ncbi:asparagine synthetase 2 [Actinidia rufa]|uniref:Asparagine synthetase 2 n=1 Tax=Actinidia rufa TaxID=165716 RepID=A0A7J0E3K2_9ERIC|nr:asparagine synthetase 2 [Actinidia rufa]
MCGILAVFGCVDNSRTKRSGIIELSRRLCHRGPDWSGLHSYQDCYPAHQRLAIVDPASGDQPLYNEDKTVVVTVNGEIYNHKDLRQKLTSHEFRTGSDCEVIAHLYEDYGEEFVDMLDGMFSFVLLDTGDKSFIAAQDAIGITPLYMGWGLDGSVWFASEMKALSDDCERFISFPPGHMYSSKQGGLRRWYNPPWFSEHIPSTPYDPLVLREAFEKGSPDLKAAREVADYLGTRHHEFHFTVQGLNKSTSAWGVEARVPFLDKGFINVAMSIDPEWKMIRRDLGRIEKWVLRNAFDDDQNPYLPKHILYRQKEQFSDGVGYSWIDGLKDHANLHNSARSTVPGGPSVACSTAKAVEWDAAWSKNLDPSGRAALGVHASAYKEAAEANNASVINGPRRNNEKGCRKDRNSCLIIDSLHPNQARCH